MPMKPSAPSSLKMPARKGRLLLPLGRVRREPLLRELARALLDQQLLFAEDHAGLS